MRVFFLKYCHLDCIYFHSTSVQEYFYIPTVHTNRIWNPVVKMFLEIEGGNFLQDFRYKLDRNTHTSFALILLNINLPIKLEMRRKLKAAKIFWMVIMKWIFLSQLLDKWWGRENPFNFLSLRKACNKFSVRYWIVPSIEKWLKGFECVIVWIGQSKRLWKMQ